MSPSDEKSPVAGMPPFADASTNGSAASLKNPLHEMYEQSKPVGHATSASDPVQAGVYGAGPAAGSSGPISQDTLGAQPPLQHASTAQRHAADHEPPAADEQAWVEKTKAAIAQTQNDPYRRVQTLQELRAAYQAGRYSRHPGSNK